MLSMAQVAPRSSRYDDDDNDSLRKQTKNCKNKTKIAELLSLKSANLIVKVVT